MARVVSRTAEVLSILRAIMVTVINPRVVEEELMAVAVVKGCKVILWKVLVSQHHRLSLRLRRQHNKNMVVSYTDFYLHIGLL